MYIKGTNNFNNSSITSIHYTDSYLTLVSVSIFHLIEHSQSDEIYYEHSILAHVCGFTTCYLVHTACVHLSVHLMYLLAILYTHTRMHACMHACTHAHTHKHTHTHIYISLNTSILHIYIHIILQWIFTLFGYSLVILVFVEVIMNKYNST